MPTPLEEACIKYLDARDAIVQLAGKNPAKFAIFHKGQGAFFSTDPVGMNVGVAVYPTIGHEANVTEKQSPAQAAAMTVPPIGGAVETVKKARAPKAAAPAAAVQETIAGPGAQAPAQQAPAAATNGEVWTQDKLRTLGREVSKVIGVEATKAAIGGPIDGVKPDQLAPIAAKLKALMAGGAAPAPKEDDFL